MTDIVMLPDPIRLALVSIENDETQKTIIFQVRTTAVKATCPRCQQPSHHVHSTYVRTLADLPCFGQHVQWQVRVRRFFCRTTTCPRKIFTERLASCAPPYARRTSRQCKTLQELAFALGGRPGARFVPVLGMGSAMIRLCD